MNVLDNPDSWTWQADGDDDYTVEPRYKVWKDDDGVLHVEVEEAWSQFCIWDMKNGKMVKSFDSHEIPF